ncbi:MFS transporter [Nocardia sp. NBC_01377]|uniref:MFS transporter n=1 Tax=Nocardia sp. NBC_01377 TaxID=2903595 RepID=UPI0038708BEB
MACSLATSVYELAVFRALQGLGAGGLMSLALTIVGDIASARERARYQSYFLAVLGTSSVVGPVDAGVLSGTDQILGITSWRWVFLVNVPVGLVTLAVVTSRAATAQTLRHREPHRLDGHLGAHRRPVPTALRHRRHRPADRHGLHGRRRLRSGQSDAATDPGDAERVAAHRHGRVYRGRDLLPTDRRHTGGGGIPVDAVHAAAHEHHHLTRDRQVRFNLPTGRHRRCEGHRPGRQERRSRPVEGDHRPGDRGLGPHRQLGHPTARPDFGPPVQGGLRQLHRQGVPCVHPRSPDRVRSGAVLEGGTTTHRRRTPNPRGKARHGRRRSRLIPRPARHRAHTTGARHREPKAVAGPPRPHWTLRGRPCAPRGNEAEPELKDVAEQHLLIQCSGGAPGGVRKLRADEPRGARYTDLPLELLPGREARARLAAEGHRKRHPNPPSAVGSGQTQIVICTVHGVEQMNEP